MYKEVYWTIPASGFLRVFGFLTFLALERFVVSFMILAYSLLLKVWVDITYM